MAKNWWEEFPLVEERLTPSRVKNMLESKALADAKRQAEQERLAEEAKYRQEVADSNIPGQTAAKQAYADVRATGNRVGSALMRPINNMLADVQAGGIGQGVKFDPNQQDQVSPSADGSSIIGYATHNMFKSKRADELNRRADMLEQAQAEEDKGGVVPDWMQSGSRGALRSLMSTIPAGVVAGPVGMIGMGAAGEANPSDHHWRRSRFDSRSDNGVCS